MPNAAISPTKPSEGIGNPAKSTPDAHEGDFWTWRVRLLHAVNRLFVRGFHHVKVEGIPRFPQTGPAILVCNHISGLDPLLIQGILRRPVVWMMAKEYYGLPVLGGVFRAIGAIPVERSGRDSAATRAAFRTLSSGRILGIFPEGKIGTTGELLPFQPGVAMIAARTAVPVYPVYLDGTNRGQEMLPAVLTPNDAVVRFGPPIVRHLEGKPNLDILSEEIRESVLNLSRSGSYGISTPRL